MLNLEIGPGNILTKLKYVRSKNGAKLRAKN
jgi:hypothetical protein